MFASVYAALKQLEKLRGKEKEKYLKPCMENENFKRVVKYALDPFLRYGATSTVPVKSDIEGLSIDKAFNELDRLASKRGTRQIDMIYLNAIAGLSTADQYVLDCILSKSLNGIGIKTANKCLPEGEKIPEFEVMLCEDDIDKFVKKHRGWKNIVSSIKKNGVRTVAVYNNGKISYLSRNGKEFPYWFHKFDRSIHCIAEILNIKRFMLDGEVCRIDGNFQKGMTQFLRLKNVDASKMEYVVFDIPEPYGDKTLEERYQKIQDIWTVISCNLNNINPDRFIPDGFNTDVVITEDLYGEKAFVKMLCHDFEPFKDKEEFIVYLKAEVEDGEEGLVLKNKKSTYQKKRSWDWCKAVLKLTMDCKVLGSEPGKGGFSMVKQEEHAFNLIEKIMKSADNYKTTDLEWLRCAYGLSDEYITLDAIKYSTIYNLGIRPPIGALVIEVGDGIVQNVGSGFTIDERRDFYEELPQLIEVEYKNKSADGKLIHPVFTRVREDK